MKYNTGIKNNHHYMSILSSVIGQLSDGIWENSRAAEKYWKSLSVSQDTSGYIVIEDRYGVCNNPIEYFANKIKHIIKIEKDDGHSAIEWDRMCRVTSNYIGYSDPITIGECYKLYELLKNRDVSKKHYAIYEKYNVRIPGLIEPEVISVEALSAESAKKNAANKLLEKFMKSAEVSVC